MSIGLIGTKIGMTREFMETGQSVPVTVIKIEKGRVLDVITKEKRGYNAVKVGFFKLKNSKLTKQMKGYFAKKNTEPKRILKEFRIDKIDEYKEGMRNYAFMLKNSYALMLKDGKAAEKEYTVAMYNYALMLKNGEGG